MTVLLMAVRGVTAAYGNQVATTGIATTNKSTESVNMGQWCMYPNLQQGGRHTKARWRNGRQILSRDAQAPSGRQRTVLDVECMNRFPEQRVF